MSAYEQEKVTIGWVIAAILAYAAEVNTIILIVLLIQTIISIIAALILSYKLYGAEKRKTHRKTRSRNGNN